MLAAIDVGTNTVRLLIGQIEGGQVAPVRYERRITRLGGEYSEEAGLAPQSRLRTMAALREYAALVYPSTHSMIRAVGTAAFRRAANGEAFAAEIRHETGLPLEIISGEEEALLTTRGVLLALDPLPRKALVIDIGGGSTEFTLVLEGQSSWHKSFPLGVVRLCEELSPGDGEALIAACLTEVREQVSARGVDPRELTLVGTAGSVTSLAAVDLGMSVYDWRRVNNYTLSRQTLDAMHTMLQPMAPAEREQVPGLEPGRGDLIMPGLQIILGALDCFGSNLIKVSDFGLLEGALLSLV